jgi:hypothetical protein
MHTSCKYITTQYIIHHLLLHLWLTVIRTMTRYTRRMPRHITILETTQQNHLTEVTQMTWTTQLIQESLTRISTLLHRQLLQTFNLLPFTNSPQSHLDQSTHSIQITQVRRTQWTEETHLTIKLL